MIENGLRNVMDLIKRQRWEKLFKRRELVHVHAVKEFYARLTLSHFKKKDVARSRVRGVEIEFDHMRTSDRSSSCSNISSFTRGFHNTVERTRGSRSRPQGPSGHIPESVMIKLQAEFERARANRIQSDLEKAQAENARLLALLQQAQSKPKP
ncbi:hypothetical protein Dimus_036240 [Dionaea muscipula]